MPDTTPILQLPYILPSQAQKHVTHNEAIRVLDVIVQLAVTARNLADPPASPDAGARFIVPAGASGDWAGKEAQIALYENGAWQFFAPMEGWTAWVTSEQVLASFNGSSWVSQADGPFSVGQLGVSATPDTINRLSVSAQATLLNHAGAGHQLKLNKASAADMASLLFQTGFSGRAEMGTIGGDDFSIKVSADGATFMTGLSIAANTGGVTLPAALRLGGQAADPVAPPDGTIWLNTTTGEVKLRSAGTTVVLKSAATLSDGDKGDITLSGGGSIWTIDTGSVTNAKLANMPAGTIKGRPQATSGPATDLTPAEVGNMLPVFGNAAKGLVPASGGGTTNFLRADGTWAVPGAVSLANLGVTATAAEINQLDGVTLGSAAQGDAAGLVPAGAVMYFARNTAPAGWLKANGAAVSRTIYADLFAAIGTTFGTGNGSSTFNLPDLRAEFLRGWDDGRGVDSGRGFGTAQGDDFKSHSHTTIGFYTAGPSVSSGENWSASGPTQNKNSRRTEGEGGTETRPRNIALLACIKF